MRDVFFVGSMAYFFLFFFLSFFFPPKLLVFLFFFFLIFDFLFFNCGRELSECNVDT